MKIEEHPKIPDILILEAQVFRDNRGYFLETHRSGDINLFKGTARRGLIDFVQGNASSSHANVLRGLHYQLTQPQGKLVRCLKGSLLDVAVDIRRGSPTFGKWVGVHLSEQDHRAIYVPPGFAHGFLAGPQGCLAYYECTTEYVDAWNRAIRWNDPDLNIGWGVPQGQVPLLSNKDRGASTLAEALAKGDVFEYEGKPVPEHRATHARDIDRRVPRRDDSIDVVS